MGKGKPAWLVCKTCLWADVLSDKSSNYKGFFAICYYDAQDQHIENADYWCNRWVCAACRKSWTEDHNWLLCQDFYKEALG